MNRRKLLEIAIRLCLLVALFFGMLVSSGFALLGMGIMTLVLTILSFDELFVESPFNQTAIANIKDNLTPLVHTSMLFFMIGILLVVVMILMAVWVIFVNFDEKVVIAADIKKIKEEKKNEHSDLE